MDHDCVVPGCSGCLPCRLWRDFRGQSVSLRFICASVTIPTFRYLQGYRQYFGPAHMRVATLQSTVFCYVGVHFSKTHDRVATKGPWSLLSPSNFFHILCTTWQTVLCNLIDACKLQRNGKCFTTYLKRIFYNHIRIYRPQQHPAPPNYPSLPSHSNACSAITRRLLRSIFHDQRPRFINVAIPATPRAPPTPCHGTPRAQNQERRPLRGHSLILASFSVSALIPPQKISFAWCGSASSLRCAFNGENPSSHL